MPPKSKPFWIDESGEKQEGYFYGESRAQVLSVEHAGRALRILMPEFVRPTAVKVTASAGDFLFLLGEELDEEDLDGDIIEGEDGIVMVARRHRERDDTYYLIVWHGLFPQTLVALGLRES
jgi:hypothetical protein